MNYLLALWNSKIQQRVLGKKDVRMKYTAECINHIKTVKLNSLAHYFLEKIKLSRDVEVYQTKLKYVSGAIELMSCMMMAPLLVLSTFAIVFWTIPQCTDCLFTAGGGAKLELSIAFAAIQMFSNLEHPIRFIPLFVRKLIEFNISMKRMYNFLNSDEIDKTLWYLYSNNHIA